MFPPTAGCDPPIVSDAEESFSELLERGPDVTLEPTPYEVVRRENKLRVRRYEPEEARDHPPVVLAPAFINGPAVLDLDEARSVVRRFLERGFDVYVADWGDPSRLDAALSIDDYVGRYLDGAVAAAWDGSDADAVHPLGFSTGAPLAAAYAALYPDDVSTLGLQGPPLDFHAEGGMFEFRELVAELDVRRLVDTFGNVPAELVDPGFSLRKPATGTADIPVRAVGGLDDPESAARALRVVRWLADGPDVPGELFRQFAEDLLAENRLITGRLTVRGRRVDLAEISVPVALVLGEEDDFVPRGASLPFLEAVSSEDTAVFDLPTGHVGTLVGDDAHRTWWPRVAGWLQARS
jgi:polyhydroxyalkanoate synthase